MIDRQTDRPSHQPHQPHHTSFHQPHHPITHHLIPSLALFRLLSLFSLSSLFPFPFSLFPLPSPSLARSLSPAIPEADTPSAKFPGPSLNSFFSFRFVCVPLFLIIPSPPFFNSWFFLLLPPLPSWVLYQNAAFASAYYLLPTTLHTYI